MRKLVDASVLQGRLLEEAHTLFERLARIKASLQAADAICEQRIQTAALREIDNHRANQQIAHEGCADPTATREPLFGQKPR
jgi:hypothetical protein